ncbi:unnamed protein product [Rhodiola kirilowii]
MRKHPFESRNSVVEVEHKKFMDGVSGLDGAHLSVVAFPSLCEVFPYLISFKSGCAILILNVLKAGNYSEALAKWEAALNFTPENAILHEQKAQILLEIGDAWKALKAATCATELEPSWAEAWITLGRTQLNFGEPDNAIESFDRALA